MKHLTPLFLSAAAGLALATATTGCQSTAEANSHKLAGGAVTRFHQLDTDNDGTVSFAEFDKGFADTILLQYNRDPDQSVSLAEWNATEKARSNKADDTFRLLDRNHDGVLTRDELEHGKRRNEVVRRIFNRIDTNHDGVISEQEARAYGIERAADRDPANHP